MRIITKTLKELRNADVTHVSLVDRSASRLPIRIIKRDPQEQDMSIDLSNPMKFFARKAEAAKPVVPEVSAVVVMGGDDAHMEHVIKALNDAGLKTDKIVKNDDGSVVFEQMDNPTEGAHIIKMSDEMMVVMKGFDSYSYQMQESADFNEQMAAQGFFPGMNTAFDALYCQVSGALCASDSPEAAAAAVGSALTKFSAYIKAMAGALPAKAFKADTAMVELARKADKGVSSVASNIPKEAPKGFTQNEWDALSKDDKAAAINKNSTNTADETKTPLKTTKAAVAVGGNNFTFDPSNLPEAPPTGFTQNDWKVLSDDGKIAVLTAVGWQHSDALTAGPTYKFELLVRKADSKGAKDADVDWTKAPKGMDQDAWGKMTDADKKKWAATNDKLGDTDDTPAKKPAKKSDEELAAEAALVAATTGLVNPECAVVKSEGDNGFMKMFDELKVGMSSLVEAMKAQGSQISDIAQKVEGQQKTVDEAVRKSDDLVKSIRSTVATPAETTEIPANPMTLDGVAKKADVNADPRSGVFDTGLMSRSAQERVRKAQQQR